MRAKKKKNKVLSEFTLPVYSQDAKTLDKVALDKNVFDGEVNKHLLWQAVKAYQANFRKGNASTKTRGEVSGGGRKPWRQKGTGRARIGSIRSPLWRAGGVVFGPRPRDFHYAITKKMKRLALKYCLNARLSENNTVVVDAIKLSTPKTKEFAKLLKKLKLDKEKTLGILEKDKNICLASKNLPLFKIISADEVNSYDILIHKKLLLSKKSLKLLANRIKKGQK